LLQSAQVEKCTKIAGGDWREKEALVNLLALQSAQLFDGWVVKKVYGKYA